MLPAYLPRLSKFKRLKFALNISLVKTQRKRANYLRLLYIFGVKVRKEVATAFCNCTILQVIFRLGHIPRFASLSVLYNVLAFRNVWF